MAEIIIADKPTLDAVNGKADAIQEGIGEIKSSTETTSQAAIQAANTIQASVDTVNDKLTEARAANLENLDVPVSTRAEQKTLETLLEDVLALKAALENLSSRGGNSGTTVTKTSALHYAQNEIREDGILLTINGTGRLRTISVRADGIPVPFWLFVDSNMLDERAGEDEAFGVAFSESLTVTLKDTKKMNGSVVLFAVYEMEV